MRLNETNRQRLNRLYHMLCGQALTKAEVMRAFGVNERTARDMLSEVAKRAPVIALSDSKGYRVAVRKEDREDVRHAIRENTKRADEILARNKELERFLRRLEEA